MGVVRQWDAQLFAAFRAAPEGSPERERLRAALWANTEDLMIAIERQLCERTRGSTHGAPVFGARRLPLEEARGAARIALAKALRDFDPLKGRFPTFLRQKMFGELQNACERNALVRIDPDRHGRSHGESFGVEYEERVHGLVDDEERVEDDDAPVAIEEVFVASPKRADVTIRASSALEIFLRQHVRFAPSARAAASELRGRLAQIATSRQEAVEHGALARALRERGVRRSFVRVPWSRNPVRGYSGIGLQSTSILPRVFSGVSLPSLPGG